MSTKLRADVALVNSGLVSSREKAQSLIMAGKVYYNEKKIIKASENVQFLDKLSIKGKTHGYVGRGALKLEKALKVFNLSVEGCIGLDIGAATGGFTDVLLQNGAKHVYAVDVGYGQLDWKIRNDSRVTVFERTNARYLTNEQIPITPDITVMDVSFISIKLLLPIAAKLMENKGIFSVLIKPQFEAGKQYVGKKGVVKDPKVHQMVIEQIHEFLPTIGYYMHQLDYSPITGPEGNIEYITVFRPLTSKDEGLTEITKENIEKIVSSAHINLSIKSE